MKPDGSKKSKIWGFLNRPKAYSVALLLSRLILSVCQSAVSLDTWIKFTKLSRVTDDIDMALETLEEYTGDLNWVPVPDKPTNAPELYGLNKLFNLYLIRLSHYFHGRITTFLVYFPSLIFGVLLLLTLFDISTVIWRRGTVKFPKLYLLLRFILYCVLFLLVFSQFMFLFYYNNSLCSMEGLYPFLFVDSGDENARVEFLRKGSCSFSHKLILTYVMSFLTLVPDAFLILISILPPFRSYSLLNAMKYFGSFFLLITVFIPLDTRRFLSLGQKAKILDFATEKYNEQAIQAGRYESVIKLLNKSKSTKMVNMKDVITFRVFASLKEHVSGPVVEAKFRLQDSKLGSVRNLVHFNFAKQLYTQSKHSNFYFYSVGLYMSVITIIDAIVGTLLIVKRHKFLVPIVVIVNFFYFFINVVHCIMLQLPMQLSNLFCKVTQYTTDEHGILFETLAISNLTCNVKYIYTLTFALVIFLSVLAFANVVNLYFIHKSH